MQTLYRLARYALPAVFLTYGVYATVYMASNGHLTVKATDTPLSGGLTAQIDEIYKTDLPLRDKAVGLVGATRYRLLGEGRKGVLAAPDGWLFTAEEARAMTEDMSVPVQRIAAIRAELAAMGAELVLVPLPAKADVEAARAVFPDLSEALAERHAAFVAALHDAEVPVVDIRPAMVAMALRGQAFFATDTHWTAEGAGAAADAVAADLKARGFAPDAQDFTRATEPAEVFSGDLVSYVTTPEFAGFAGLKGETVTPIRAVAAAPVDLSAGDLFATAQSGGIALVGTSYSANPRWSFADNLMLGLYNDVVNYAQEGRGPVRPLYDMLADPAFVEAPPAVVIWEFPVRYLADPTAWEKEPQDGA